MHFLHCWTFSRFTTYYTLCSCTLRKEVSHFASDVIKTACLFGGTICWSTLRYLSCWIWSREIIYIDRWLSIHNHWLYLSEFIFCAIWDFYVNLCWLAVGVCERDGWWFRECESRWFIHFLGQQLPSVWLLHVNIFFHDLIICGNSLCFWQLGKH